LTFQRWRLESEVEDLFAFDIGVMPLRDDARTRGKCAFKAIQYMALGIPAVASPVGANVELIQHQVNGLLPCNVDEWVDYLSLLICNGQLRQRLGTAGRETIIDRYSLQAMLPELVNLLQQVAVDT
jgi:glycosyltransferase involved in cell wall biosynthesis